ncbi:MAG: LamG domain-containing protein [Saprospiraceae bacterium]|nr:LamG domain-containing protein [Saprospiraceae bacterium]
MKNVGLFAISFFILFHGCKDEEPGFNPLETGFVSQLSFNGNLNDHSNFITATDSCGAPNFVTGVLGVALLVDENCPTLTFDKQTFRNSQKISVSLWFKTSENGNIWHFIRSSDFQVFTKFGEVGISISIPETESAKAAFEPDTWTHFVGTYDGTTIKTYINGQFAASTKHKGEISSPGYFFELNGGGTWTGAIDELYIYDSALSEEQVKQLYTM